MNNNITNNPLLSLNISILCRSQLLLPVLFLFYQQNGLTAGDFFLFEGISSFISLLLLIPSGYIADFFSKKYILLLSFLLLLIKSFLWIFFHGYFIILLGTILNNVSKSLYFAAADSYIYEYLSYNKREKEMLNKYGKMNFYFSLGIAITSIFSSIFYSYFGSLTLLIIDFILSSIATFLIFNLPNLPIAHKKNKKSLKHRIIEMYVIHIPAFFQIRSFLEMDLDALLKAGQIKFAENIINGADLFAKANSESYKFIARVLVNNNYHSLAGVFLEKAKNVCYVDPELHYLCAKCSLHKHDINSAKKSLELAIETGFGYYPAKKLLNEINLA